MNEKREYLKKLVLDNIEKTTLDGKLRTFKHDKSMIDKIESELQIKFPESYLWFLENLGIVSGLSIEHPESIAEWTLDDREYGLPKELLYLEGGTFEICINTENGNVVYWWPSDQEYDVEYETFEDYAIDSIEEWLDNWDDSLQE